MPRVGLLAVLALLASCAPPGERTPVAATAAPPPGLAAIAARLEPALRARDAVALRLRRDSGTAVADSILLDARGALALAVDSAGTSLWSDTTFQAWLAGDSAAAAQAESWFAARGLRLSWSEGSAYLIEDTGHWLRLAGPYLTAPLREHLALRDHDEAQGFTDDAALVIPWDSLAERIAAWDRFIAGHPGFTLLGEAEMWRDLYLRTYLTGIDNSRVFDDTLVADVRRSYERFARRHGDTPSGALVGRYREVLRASGGRETAEVREFWRANGINSMIGMQPPIR